jgi:hypothetical protein
VLHIETPSGVWAALCDRILAFLRADLITVHVDGRQASGFRSPDNPSLWIRDHSDILRGGVFMHADVQSAVTLFADYQAFNGRVFDYVTTAPGTEPENWEKWVRVPLEADVEFRFVKAAYLAWQASGDDAWLDGVLPHLERALAYTATHPWRWDAEHGLVKRAYSVDTWDFDYTAGRHPWLNFQITDHTFWGLMHGDASGTFEAARLLAQLYAHRGHDADAARWTDWAAGLRERANALLFNGRFYTHFHKLTPVTVEGVDEAEQLSLSNPMGINRGLATHEMSVAILDEYRRRRDTTGAFAEWFSIDPPFPHGHFGEPKIVPGSYCNGGIMPLVGGELARAAFEHGREAYGVEILRQYAEMIERTGETYLWYFPDGTPSTVETSTSPEAMPTDGWGASAMLYAAVEGLAGVQDLGHSYRHVRCAPRWAATDEPTATVRAAYEASGAGFAYDYAHDADAGTVRLDLAAPGADVDLHLLLPPGARPTGLTWNGAPADWQPETIEGSVYVNARGRVDAAAVVEVTYERH